MMAQPATLSYSSEMPLGWSCLFGPSIRHVNEAVAPRPACHDLTFELDSHAKSLLTDGKYSCTILIGGMHVPFTKLRHVSTVPDVQMPLLSVSCSRNSVPEQMLFVNLVVW